ncbi:Medium-chain acyl-CoA ligase ACSF2, mitochondrial [Halotydeus destructor]|nr:Medium-chain acyl-CoA ligase ACSF2, mitochondrial [Halotydeus destructor]
MRLLTLLNREPINLVSLFRKTTVTNCSRTCKKSTICGKVSANNREARRYSSVFVQSPYSYAFTRSNKQLDYFTVGQTLMERAKTNGGDLAVMSIHEGIEKSYKELDDEANKLSDSLIALGLRKNDVVGLWSANSYNALLIQYACARIGLILCTINPAYKASELEYVLAKAKVKALFMPGMGSGQEVVNRFSNILNDVNGNQLPLERLIVIDGEPSSKKHASEKLSNLLASGKADFDATLHHDTLTADDPSIIMFTSGTTGKPKGAVLSHSNLLNNAVLTANRLGVAEGQRLACIPVPLFHIFGMVYGSIMMTKVGLPIMLTGYKYNTKVVVDAMKQHGCTHIMMVPAMTVDIINYLEANKVDIPSLKAVITGSAPTPVQVAKKFVKVVPSAKQFLIRYGSTETGGCMSMPLVGDGPDKTVDNVGAPLSLTEMKVVNPKTGTLVKLGQQGEVWARGHNVMLGYWEDETKTKEAIENGWFKTGDMATMDDKGYIKLVGRTKELIIRGGENVYPKEIEELLHQHPAVYEAFACGVPDKRLGEEICAWIKLKDGVEGISQEDIKAFCKDKISYYKVPRYVLFVNEFPRTPTGKAQKFAMTEQSIKMLDLDK